MDASAGCYPAGALLRAMLPEDARRLRGKQKTGLFNGRFRYFAPQGILLPDL